MYIKQNYDSRLKILIDGMRSLKNLICIYEEQESELQKSYDLLCEQFAKETESIPEINGVKTIDKDIMYYANGLIEYGSTRLIGKPFEYENKSKLPKPQYNIFKKSNDSQYVTSNYISSLLGNYIRFRLSGRCATNMPKFADLKNSLESFRKTIKKLNYDTTEQNYSFAKQYYTLYEELLNKYTKAVSFVTNAKDPINMREALPAIYGSDKHDCYRYFSIMPMMHEHNAAYRNIYVRNKTCVANDINLKNVKMPVISKEHVDKIIELYDTLYKTNIEAQITINNESYYGASAVKCKREIAEIETQKDVVKYYEQYVQYIDSELMKTDPTFDKYGYMAMFIEENADKNLIERIMCLFDNNSIYDDESNRNYNHDRLFANDYDYNTHKTIVVNNVDEAFYNKNKDLYDKYVNCIAKSVDFMISCIDDIISSLSGIQNNPDLTEWMIKRKIIPEYRTVISAEK